MKKKELNQLSERVIGLAAEVHRDLGPGLLKNLYESALCIELGAAGLRFERQKLLPIYYKRRAIGDFRTDLFVEDRLLLGLESTERSDTFLEAQIISYLKISGLSRGLLINFNTRLLKDGIKRFTL